MAATRRHATGDNLSLLRELPDKSVQLIATDPPYCTGTKWHGTPGTAAENIAFEDSWEAPSEEQLAELSAKSKRVVEAALELAGGSMAGFLAFMAPRLEECKRVLKQDGSLYLQCDHKAEPYLRLLLDAVFGRGKYRNTIIWEKAKARNIPQRGFPTRTEVLICYAKSSQPKFNAQYLPHRPEYIKQFYNNTDGSPYRLGDTTEPGFKTDPAKRKEAGGLFKWGHCLTGSPSKLASATAGGAVARTERKKATGDKGSEFEYEFLGHTRVWRWRRKQMEELYKEGRIVQVNGGVPRYKLYLSESKGRQIGNLWDDVRPLIRSDEEFTGYPTQKPVALYERIVLAHTDRGDVVLDPFAGSGTTLIAAEKHDRGWIGFDREPGSYSTLAARWNKEIGSLNAGVLPAREKTND